MIYTITFNPSLDYIVTMDSFLPGEVNRTESEMLLPGGKGLNVSMVLKNLGIDSTALGFLAGFTGEEIRRRMEALGCHTDFIWISEGFSRINLKLKAREESEINGQGPSISTEDLDRLYEKIRDLNQNDILVLAGSIPGALPDSIYGDMMKSLERQGVRIVVDATRDLLLNVMPYQPFLIKPNHHELGEMFGVSLETQEEVIPYAWKLKEMGAVNVLISMAGAGAVLIDEQGKVHRCQVPTGKVVNSVGAGDSMVAGFLTGYLETGTYEQAFVMGIATGSASAFSKQLATRAEVEVLLITIKNSRRLL